MRLRAVWSRPLAESDQSAIPEPSRCARSLHLGRRAGHAGQRHHAGRAGRHRSRSIATVDPAQGGDPARLRDGGISNPGNPAYVYNATGATGYSDRLNQLLDALDEQQSLRSGGGSRARARRSSDFASSLGRLAAGGAQIRERRRGLQERLAQRSSEALSSATGVNLDEEMTLLLELERSYQASSKLITTIDNMFGALLSAAGR